MRVSKKSARILSFVLACSLLVLILSAAAFSAEDLPETEIFLEEVFYDEPEYGEVFVSETELLPEEGSFETEVYETGEEFEYEPEEKFGYETGEEFGYEPGEEFEAEEVFGSEEINEADVPEFIELEIRDRYDLGEDFDYSPFYSLNFTSRRIMVCTADSSILDEDPAVISGYGGVYLLQFDDETEALRAYAYYYFAADLVEVDTGISIAEGEAAGVVNTYDVMTEQNNPFSELEEALYTGGGAWFDIALIDTGADGAMESVSMIGDYTGDENGHGTAMLGYIREQNPVASVLSVKALGGDGTGNISEIYAGIEYAISRNVRIINLSVSALASADSAVIRMAVDEAVSRGIMVVGAAGNNGRNAAWYIPGGIASACIIGASSENGERLSTSNYGETVDYYVRAATTSEAAARFSGWFSLNGSAAIEAEMNKGFLFAADYTPESEPDTQIEDPSMSREILVREDAGGIIAEQTVSCRNGIVRYQLRGESTVLQVYATMPVEEYDSLLVNDKTAEFEIDDVTHMITIYLTKDYVERAGSLIITEASSAGRSDSLFSVAGDSVTILDNPKIHFYWNGEDCTDRYFVLDNGAIGFCGDYKSYPPGIGTSAVPQASSDINLLKVLYYGADGPGAISAQEASAVIGAELSQDGFRAATSLAVSIAMTGYQGLPILSVIGDRLYQDLIARPTPSGAQVYVLTFGGSNYYQPIAYIGGFKGTVTLKKSTEEGVDLSEHPLTGAIYSIRNENGSWAGNSFITGADGTGYLTGAAFCVESEEEAARLASPENVYTYVAGEGWYYAAGETEISLNAGKQYFVWEAKAPDDPIYIRNEGYTELFSLAANETLRLDAGFHSIFQDELRIGHLKIRKVSAYPGTEGISGYSLKGAIYGVFRDAACTDKLGELTTGADGNTDELEVIAGTYYVKELSASEGYLLDPMVYPVTVGTESVAVVISTEVPKTGFLKIRKQSADPAVTGDNSDYSLEGAVYGVFRNASCTDKLGELITGADGNTNELEILAGTYYVKELSAPKGFDLDPEIYPVTVKTEEVSVIISNESPKQGLLRIRKQSSAPSVTDSNNNYSLEGAIYGVFRDAACTDKLGELTTGADGNTNELEVPAGTYYVKELSASEGYTLDQKVYTVTVGTGSVAVVISNEVPKTGSLRIRKQSADPGTAGNSDYSLAGAKYGVFRDQSCMDKMGELTTGADGNTDELEVPAGTYYVKELSASPGYMLDLTVYPVTVRTESVSVVISKEIPETGLCKIRKQSAEPLITGGNDRYSLQGAVYGVFRDATCTDKLGELTTGADGNTGELEVLAGTYYVKELSASGGYLPDPTVYPVTIKTGSSYVVISNEAPKKGSIRIEKHLDTGMLSEKAEEIIRNSPEYSVEGAGYLIYTDAECRILYSETVLAVSASDETGMTGVSDTITGIPLGVYYLKETIPGKNLLTDPAVYRVEITEENYTVVQSPSTPSKDRPELGELKLSKVSEIPEITRDNPCYDLAGAEYGIYTEKDCADEHLYQKAVTDGQGQFTVTEIPFGTYYIKELRASEGYGLAACADEEQPDSVHIVSLNASARSAVIICEEPVEGLPIAVLLQKIDAQTKAPLPVAGGTFQDAEYTVWYYTNYAYSGTPERTWIFAADANGTVKFVPDQLREGSSELYYDLGGNPVIPRGSFIVRETKAPEGYLPDPEEYCFQVNGEALSGSDHITGLAPVITVPAMDPVLGFLSEEQIGRGEFSFEKTDGGAERIANCLFAVTQIDTGEVHYIVTDPNGVYRSSAFDRNNGNDSAVTLNEDGTYTVDESRLSYQNNVWFSMDHEGNTAEPDQDMASFPYGTYQFREIETSVNKGLQMITFTGSVYDASDYVNEGIIYQLGTKDDGTEGQPCLHTTAWDGDEYDKLAETDRETIRIIDKVSYSDLRRGVTYLVKGKIWDKTNGVFYKDKNGQELEITEEFTAESSEGYLEMVFSLSGDILRESGTRSLVVFEWLYEDQILLDVHADPDDKEQEILVVQEPMIRTTLTGDDKEHEVCAEKDMRLIDVVACRNLIQGRIYKIHGILMDKETGRPAADEHGAQITADLMFTAEQEEQSFELEFIFDGETLAGHTLVAFEYLYYKNIEQASHEDPEDEGQTVWLPKVKTSLKDADSLKQQVQAAARIELTDTVTYENLTPGCTYTVQGILMDKETEEPVTGEDGRNITAETDFIAEVPDGVIELTFVFDGLTLEEHSVVAFETLERNGRILAVHADINDQDQTVEITPEPEPPTEPPTEPSTEPPTEPSTEPPTEPPTQPPTEPPTQPPTEPPTQPPTEPPTQPPTEPPTQPPTEPPTQPPTEPPTQPPTEPQTQPPTEPNTTPPGSPPNNPPGTPRTGDINNTLLYIIICCSALVIIMTVTVVLIHRKNRS